SAAGRLKTTTESRGVYSCCRVYKTRTMMPASQSEPAGSGPPRLHRPFKFYDPEVVAILTILFGLFQVLLGIPTYYLSVYSHALYLCPVFVGAVHLTGGSFALVCERSPSRQLLKNSLYSSLGGLLVGLSAIVIYGYTYNSILNIGSCDSEHTPFVHNHCLREEFIVFFRTFAAFLSVHDIIALVLQGLLSFSALKGLKAN
ncbi:hypothetical protein NFI96_013207, partial [Prochilodus magdalenae]